MIRLSAAVLAILSASACSDRFMDEANALLAARQATTLAELSLEARQLSDRYVDAAGKTRTVQDVFAFLTVAAAYSTVSGAVGDASEAVLARRALAGAASTQGARRLVPATAIRAIYIGARRLNCVSTAAGIGEALQLSDQDDRAALAATIGSIDHIRILTREGLVREVEDFATVLAEFTEAARAGADPEAGRTAKLDTARGADLKLDQYLKLLANCTTEKGTTVLAEVPKAN
jgi:hypothetical protein